MKTCQKLARVSSKDLNTSKSPRCASRLPSETKLSIWLQAKKALKKLAILKDWTHINCSYDDEAILETIEDDVLRDVVSSGFDIMREAARPVSRRSPFLSDNEDEEMAPAVPAKPAFQGGEVTYVFHVSPASDVCRPR